MKNFDIKNSDLKELSGSELEEVNGGVVLEAMLGIAVGLGLAYLFKRLF